MDKYLNLAKQLLQYELDPQDNQYCITLYQPNEGNSKKQIFQHIKSLLQQALKENKDLRHAENEHELLEEIREQILNLDSLLKGLAIFFRVTAEGSLLKLVEDKIHIIPVGEKPVREFYASQRYDVDQLFMIAHGITNGLVVDLKRKESFFYAYYQGELEKIDHMENDHIGEKEDEYLERFAPKRWGEGIIHSTGSDKFDRRMLKQNELFLQDLVQRIKEISYSFQHLVLFYTNLFEPFIENYLDELRTIFPDTHLVTVEKNIKKRQLFKKEALKVIDKHIQEHKLQILEELEDDYYSVVESWEDIAEAVRNGQVRKLLIRPNLSLKGYVAADNLLYVNQPEIEAQEVENLIPWLVAAVAKQDGEIVVFSEDEFEGRPHKMAQLRYKLNKQEKRS